MLKAVTKIDLFTTNQNEALAFYTEKLGFVIRDDITNGDFRWLTVSLPSQPDVQFVLLDLKSDDHELTKAEADTIMSLLRDGKLPPSPVIETDDIQKVYEEFTAKGVEFIRPPTARPWGSSDAQFKDNSGNTWLLLQSGSGSQA